MNRVFPATHIAPLLIALSLACPGCGGPSSETHDTGAFLLTANTNVEGFGRLTTVVRSNKPGHCYFRPVDDLLSKAPFGDAMVELTFNEDGTLATHTVIENEIPGRKPTAITSTGGEVCTYRKFENSPRDLVYCENGEMTTLVKDINSKSGMGSYSRIHYEPGQELTMLQYEDPETVYLKQEERLEGEDKQINDLVAHGTGFFNGSRTHVFIDQAGAVKRFDPEAVAFVDEPELAWLSFITEVPEFTVPCKYKPRAFVFTKDMAVVKRDDKVLLRNRAGESFEMERFRNQDDNIAGELKANSEAMRAGPLGVSVGCAPLPLDDNRVLIIDININKMIVVSPSPGKH